MPAFTPSPIDVPALTALLDGKYVDLRTETRAAIVEHASVLEDAETMTTAQFRDRVKDLVVLIAQTGQSGFGFPKEYGGGEDYGANVAGFETLAFSDLSVLVKMGVQFGLFGGAVYQLGTKPHHDKYVADIVSAKLLGAFAMTETGHGSNVQAIGTTASYDSALGVRHQHSRRRVAQGLHRQCRDPRAGGRGLRAAHRRRRQQGSARAVRAAA